MVRIYILIALVLALLSGAFGLRLLLSKKANSSHGKRLERSVKFNPPAKVFIPILLYHHIGDPDKNGSVEITTEQFEEQIKTLKENNYTFITISDIGDILDGYEELPKKPVVISVDDGYDNFYTKAFPVLKQYQAKATLYVITGLVGKTGYVSKAQLKELAQSDLIELGAHTVSHPNLKNMERLKVFREIETSKNYLERNFGVEVRSFAYPYGSFSDETEKIVRELGFTVTVGTHIGTEIDNLNRFSIPRLPGKGKFGEELLKYLEQRIISDENL